MKRSDLSAWSGKIQKMAAPDGSSACGAGAGSDRTEPMAVEKLISGEQLGDKVGLFARVTIFPGKELDYHEHHGETETYHIISGEGEYTDDSGSRMMHAGETSFCRDGGGHGIRNTGKEDLIFIALIIKK